jgi:hypothetical protein
MITYLINKIKNIHNLLLAEPIITKKYLDLIIINTFDTYSDKTTIAEIYTFSYYLITNFCGLLFSYKYNNDYKYINDIIKSNDIEEIEQKIINNKDYYYNRNIVNENKFMKEIIEKTLKITNAYDNLYSNLTKYVSGNCWLNIKLSNNISLDENDQQILDSINTAVQLVEPLSYPITLFHGFEKYTNYSEYKVRDVINIPGFLSKSLSFNVANNFASVQNYYRPKFIVVNYDKGSKQIHHNIRILNNEFEFLTNSNEKLKVVRICNYYSNLQYLTFYICEPII